MENQQKKYVEVGNADPQAARTKDSAFGIDDIGLPEDLKPEGASKPEEVRPDPEKAKKER
jgi:hypothetical protein